MECPQFSRCISLACLASRQTASPSRHTPLLPLQVKVSPPVYGPGAEIEIRKFDPTLRNPFVVPVVCVQKLLYEVPRVRSLWTLDMLWECSVPGGRSASGMRCGWQVSQARQPLLPPPTLSPQSTSPECSTVLQALPSTRRVMFRALLYLSRFPHSSQMATAKADSSGCVCGRGYLVSRGPWSRTSEVAPKTEAASSSCEVVDWDASQVGCQSFFRPPTRRIIMIALVSGVTVVERLAWANWIESPAGTHSDFRTWESCWTMPLVGEFYRGYLERKLYFPGMSLAIVALTRELPTRDRGTPELPWLQCIVAGAVCPLGIRLRMAHPTNFPRRVIDVTGERTCEPGSRCPSNATSARADVWTLRVNERTCEPGSRCPVPVMPPLAG
ncbi:hypothetical protein PR048_030784 [Dryococelus australis]|uniref:Uncharacterized protein n=1 Tax=Dryococelus australis TaxID=614101 RepID=A0ABQ9G9V8_9NEOP|nr:hypothetical protein PR048_030784 [Dryococelus australis]